MDVCQNAEITVEVHGQTDETPNETEARPSQKNAATTSENEVERPVIEKLNDCPDGKCETESASCASAEEAKPKVEKAENSSKEILQASRNVESPEPSCSICLGKMENKSFTNSCFHQFCFSCLLEWSKVKPECPLCKQPFKSIVHNVRSMEDYDQYHLRLDDYNAWENRDGRRFRYRSTLTSERRRELALGRFLMSHRLPSRNLDQPRSSGRHLLTTSDYRRHIYESGLWVRVQAATGSSRYRESSPAFYSQNPACTHRLIPWLNRELNALDYGSQVAFLMELILSLIHRFHIQSPEFRELVQPYFLGNTSHFIHEFYNFARSPHDMVDYDRRISYTDGLTQLVEDTDSDSDIVVLSPDRTSVPRWSQRALQSSPRTLTTGRDHTTVLNRARDFLESIAILGTWSSEPRPSTSALPLPTTSTVTSAEPGPSSLHGINRSETHGFRRLRSVVTVPSSRTERVKTELTIMEEDGDDDCMIIGYEEGLPQRSPVDVIVLSDSDDDVIMETSVPAEVTLEPPVTVDEVHLPSGTADVMTPTTPEPRESNHESDRCSRSSSTPQHTSQSISPVRSKKVTKHHKRAKSRHSRSRSRSKSSSSNTNRRHHEKRSHKKHSKSSGQSKFSTNQLDTESSEHGHSYHKTSKKKKKKHSHKHKSAKTQDRKDSPSSQSNFST